MKKQSRNFSLPTMESRIKDKAQKLKELRVKMLGEEDAESYSRQKLFEEESAKIK
jgi:hypothetical protein